MTQPLSKADLIALQQETYRREWLKRLRAEGYRQCIGLHEEFTVDLNRRNGIVIVHRPVHVCAMALLGEITHGRYWWRDPTIRLGAIGAKAGLTIRQTQTIAAMNDGGTCYRTGGHMRPHTFREIADQIEAWFPE